MNLGTFIKSEETGIIAGTMTTLLTSVDIEYRPIPREGNGPDYRIFVAGTEVEVGAAWLEEGKNSGKLYLDSRLDSPELESPLYPALVKEEDGTYVLKWTRPKKKNGNGNDEADDRPPASGF